jgi:hypothetical protein
VKVGATEAIDVATGGAPQAALAAAALRLTRGHPYVLEVAVRHDDDCPCLEGRAMVACTCEIVRLEGRRVA